VHYLRSIGTATWEERAVSDDSEHEDARVADEARRRAREEEAHAMAEAEPIVAGTRTREMKKEELRQLGVIYGGLIAVAVVMVQGFLEASSLDTSARVGTIAFAVALALLAALVLVNRQEVFRGRGTTSVLVTLARVVAQLAVFVGVVAAFWHITWVAGVTFLVVGLVAVGVHSAGFWRVESPRSPTTNA
jgi:cation transport ATPase